MEETKALVNTETGELTEYDPNELAYEFLKDPFKGVSEQVLSDAQIAILSEPADLNIIEVKPTGEIYVPHMRYRQLWCKAFGAGGWGLVPLSRPRFNPETSELLQEWALYVGGRFISSTVAGSKYYPQNKRTLFADAAESIKSDAIRRLGKDLGMFPELWDRHFARRFVEEHCIQVEVLTYKNEVDKWLRLKRAMPFPEEANLVEMRKKSAEKQASKTTAKVQTQPASKPEPQEKVTSTPAPESHKANVSRAEEWDKLQAEKKISLKSTAVVELLGKSIPADERVSDKAVRWFNENYVGPHDQKDSLEEIGKFHPSHLVRHLMDHFGKDKTKLAYLNNEQLVALVKYVRWAKHMEGGELVLPWYADKAKEAVGEAPQGNVMIEAQTEHSAITLEEVCRAWFGPESNGDDLPAFPGNSPNIETVATRKWGKIPGALGEYELSMLYRLALAQQSGAVKVETVEDAVRELEL